MTKRERRRYSVLVKTPWTKEWLAAMGEQDFSILHGITMTMLRGAERKLTDDQLLKRRLLESEMKRRAELLTAV